MKNFTKIALGLLCAAAASPVHAQSGPVKIGVMSDSSQLCTPRSAARAPSSPPNWPSMISAARCSASRSTSIAGDHQNKVDVATAIARRWTDEMAVTAFADVATSSTALAVQALEKEQQKAVVLISGGGARALSDEACSPVGVNWVWNTYSDGAGTANAAVKAGLQEMVHPGRGLRFRPCA